MGIPKKTFKVLVKFLDWTLDPVSFEVQSVWLGGAMILATNDPVIDSSVEAILSVTVTEVVGG